MTRPRLLAAVAAATALLAPSAYASPNRPQITDPKGDAVTGAAELDIVSARWSTSGRGNDKALVATMTLAAPPKDGVPYTYELSSVVRDCGVVWFRYTPGALLMTLGGTVPGEVWAECADEVYDSVITLTVTGSTITWSIPVDVLPPQITTGSLFYDFAALADAGEPAYGHSVAGIADQALDDAFGDGSWRLR
ncbi:MAG TPA: hypothetical protein VGX28_03740 [Frankiaceae bacterium]|nr:hypothetical protein [Frankiaceae bacterium]